MEESNYSIVRQAVVTKCPISAVYENHHRIFCPHRLGKNKQGKFQVLCYQSGGSSSKGLAPARSSQNWRCVALNKLKDVKLTAGEWETAQNYSRPASCIHIVDVDADGTVGITQTAL